MLTRLQLATTVACVLICCSTSPSPRHSAVHVISSGRWDTSRSNTSLDGEIVCGPPQHVPFLSVRRMTFEWSQRYKMVNPRDERSLAPWVALGADMPRRTIQPGVYTGLCVNISQRWLWWLRKIVGLMVIAVWGYPDKYKCERRNFKACRRNINYDCRVRTNFLNRTQILQLFGDTYVGIKL